MPDETAKSIISDAMAAKKGEPDYIIEIMEEDKKSGEMVGTGKYYFNFVKLSDHIKKIFNLITFKKNLYIYDKERCIYKPHSNEIETFVREEYVKHNIVGKLSTIERETMTHVHSMGNSDVYPFNSDPTTIPVRNCIVKIDYKNNTITSLPNGPEHLFTYRLNVVFDEKASREIPRKVLAQWVDEENINSLIQIPAQAIMQMQRCVPFKKAHLIQGEPNAGKSTFVSLLVKFFTTEYVTSIRLQQICVDRFVGGQLEGKLLNIYDDLEDVPLDTIDAFKTLTGICTHNVERKYCEGYVGRVTSVHVFTCNYPPEYPEKVKRDVAFWKRWEYIRFQNTYQVDTNFEARTFTDEFMSGFLNLILDAMLQMDKTGLLVDSDVQTVMENWNINSDPLYDFLSWGFTMGNSIENYSKIKLHNAYLDYCSKHQIPEHKQRLTLTSFTQAIQSHGFLPTRVRIKNVSYEVYTTKMRPVLDNIKDLSYGIVQDSDPTQASISS